MKRIERRWKLTCGGCAIAIAVALAGCAENSTTDESVFDSNLPPVLSANRTVTVSENTTFVTTVTATDADGDTLTFALTGGDDIDLFNIETLTGNLRFVAAPDFEAPADSNRDNIYSVIVSVFDDNGGSDAATFTVSVADAPDNRYIDRIFSQTNVSDDIVFATIDGQSYALNIVTPAEDDARNRPFILFATGGAFVLTIPELSLSLARNFAERGYVAAVMDYRTLGRQPASGNEFRLAAVDATHDMIAAVRFARANADEFGIDPDQVIVAGTSAGAIMAATLATTDPDDPAPSVLADYLDTVGGVYGNIGDHLDQSPVVQGAFALSGGVFGLDTIDRNSAPIYGAHEELDSVAPCKTFQLPDTEFELSGTCDYVPFYQSIGVPAQSFIVPNDDGHVDFSDEEYAQILSEAARFFFDNVINTD